MTPSKGFESHHRAPRQRRRRRLQAILSSHNLPRSAPKRPATARKGTQSSRRRSAAGHRSRLGDDCVGAHHRMFLHHQPTARVRKITGRALRSHAGPFGNARPAAVGEAAVPWRLYQGRVPTLLRRYRASPPASRKANRVQRLGDPCSHTGLDDDCRRPS